MKIVIYKYDDILKLTNLINTLQFSGFSEARCIASIGDILDSGEIKDRNEKKELQNDID